MRSIGQIQFSRKLLAKNGKIFFGVTILVFLISIQMAYGQFHLEPSPLNIPDYPVRNKKLFIVNEDLNNPIVWTATSDKNWLTLSPTSGTVTESYCYITARVSRNGLSPGEHFATIKLATSHGDQTVSVRVFTDPGVLPEIQIEHTVTISQPETHFAHVKTVLRNVSWMEWVRMSSHTFELVDNWLENLTAYDQNCTPLDYDLVIEDNSLRWRRLTIQNPGASDVVAIEYDIHFLNHDLNDPNAYQAGIMEERALFDSGAIFFSADQNQNGNFAPMHDDLSIMFSGQSNWTSATPWVGSGNIYNITEVELGAFFSYGNYDIEVLDLNGLEVRIAIPPGAMAYTSLTKNELVEKIRSVAVQFQEIYGNPSRSGFELNDILNIMITYPPLNSHDNGPGSICLDISDFDWNLYNSVTGGFEYWNLCDPSVKGWSNTVGAYQTYRNFKLLGYISESQFEDELRLRYDNYMNEVYGTKYDVSIPDLVDLLYYNNSGQLSEEDLIGYQKAYDNKAFLVWLMVDRKIQKKTNSKKDIYDFLVYMSQNHATDGCPDETAINGLSLISGYDFTGFFNDYYYGTRKLACPFKSVAQFIPAVLQLLLF